MRNTTRNTTTQTQATNENSTAVKPARPNKKSTGSKNAQPVASDASLVGINNLPESEKIKNPKISLKSLIEQERADRDALRARMELDFTLSFALFRCVDFMTNDNIKFNYLDLLEFKTGENGKLSFTNLTAFIDLLKSDPDFKRRFDREIFWMPVVGYTDKDGNFVPVKKGKKFETEAESDAEKAALLKDTRKILSEKYRPVFVNSLSVRTEKDAYKDKFNPMLIQKTLQNLYKRLYKVGRADTVKHELESITKALKLA